MSGPKTARYSVKLRQRQRLQAQLRKEREARILAEQKRREREARILAEQRREQESIQAEKLKRARIHEQQESSFRDAVMEKIVSGFELSFSNISNRKALNENKILSKINQELEKLSEFTLSEELEAKFEQLREKADEIQSPEYLENFFSLSVLPFVKECRMYDRLVQEAGDDYQTLCLRYEYMAKELGYEPEQIPFSKEAISILLERIAKLEEEEQKISEEDYICQCIDEAMAEMNYSVVGNRKVTKKNGKKFRNVLYKFEEGTVVNVTYAGDGQITMELGGADSEDRMPTEEESVSLVEDMKSFCDDFYEIEKKLEAKGVESKRLSHLPLEAQFAQIINVSDYEMLEDIGSYEGFLWKNIKYAQHAERKIRQ